MKKILAAVDGSAMSLVALRYGAEIAVRAKGSVRAVFVKDVKVLESSALAAAHVATETLEAAVAHEAEESLGRARDVCGRVGLMKIATDVRRGVVPLVLLEASAGSDLVTMGRWGGNALWATGLLGSAVEAVVRKIGKPVLVASGPFQEPRRIVAAFDGSPFAQRALELANEAAGLFGLHAQTLTVTEGDPVAEIAGEATAETITFMGAFGHSPMRELVLGSVTEQVMRKARGPVVLCR
jgi:nucleotide-binding universal stress UspA family protein